jgi:hypothetical protein
MTCRTKPERPTATGISRATYRFPGSFPARESLHNVVNAIYALSCGCGDSLSSNAPDHVGAGLWLLCAGYGVLSMAPSARAFRAHIAGPIHFRPPSFFGCAFPFSPVCAGTSSGLSSITSSREGSQGPWPLDAVGFRLSACVCLDPGGNCYTFSLGFLHPCRLLARPAPGISKNRRRRAALRFPSAVCGPPISQLGPGNHCDTGVVHSLVSKNTAGAFDGKRKCFCPRSDRCQRCDCRGGYRGARSCRNLRHPQRSSWISEIHDGCLDYRDHGLLFRTSGLRLPSQSIASPIGAGLSGTLRVRRNPNVPGIVHSSARQ